MCQKVIHSVSSKISYFSQKETPQVLPFLQARATYQRNTRGGIFKHITASLQDEGLVPLHCMAAQRAATAGLAGTSHILWVLLCGAEKGDGAVHYPGWLSWAHRGIFIVPCIVPFYSTTIYVARFVALCAHTETWNFSSKHPFSHIIFSLKPGPKEIQVTFFLLGTMQMLNKYFFLMPD